MADSDDDDTASPHGGDGSPPGFDGRFGPAGGPDREGDVEAASEAPSGDPAPAVELDPQTEALIAAAEAARRAGGSPRPWRGPRNFLILGGVLLGIAALAWYAVSFAKNLERRNAEIRMEALDEQRRKYLEERAWFLAKGFRPAGEEAKPLTAAQFAELQALRRRFGLPPVPPEQAGTQPILRPDPQPASAPADPP